MGSGKQIPFVDYLSIGAEPYLTAKECTTCGALFFDRRNACASCGSRAEFAQRRLGSTGVVRTFSIVHRSTPDVKTPFVSAVVDLDGGGKVKANLVDVDPDPEHVRLGMPVEFTTFVIGTDPEGTEAVSFGYRPRAEVGATTSGQ